MSEKEIKPDLKEEMLEQSDAKIEKQDSGFTEFEQAKICFIKFIADRQGLVFDEEELSERIMGNEEWVQEIYGKNKEIQQNVCLKIIGLEKNDRYNPDQDFSDWENVTEREEAERKLRREILVNEELALQLGQADVALEQILDSNEDPKKGDVYLLKKEPDSEFAYRAEDDEQIEVLRGEQGKAYAKTLLELNDRFDTQQMCLNIRERMNIKSWLDLENQVFEDYFDHRAGYEENTQKILSTFPEDIDEAYDNYITPKDMRKIMKELSPEQLLDLNTKKSEFGAMPNWMLLELRMGVSGLKEKIAQTIDRYSTVIENEKYQQDRYFLVHGESQPDNTVYYKDGRVGLVNWSMAGTTKNKLLAAIYDFGSMSVASKGNQEYIDGIEEGVREYLQNDPEAAEAVIRLAKLRSYADEFAGMEKALAEGELDEDEVNEKREFVMNQIKGALDI